jgi:hypothetical protein
MVETKLPLYFEGDRVIYQEFDKSFEPSNGIIIGHIEGGSAPRYVCLRKLHNCAYIL